MLAVTKPNVQKNPIEKIKNLDIIITKHETVITYDKNQKIEKRIPKKINITKKVNETKKLIKTMTAEEKIAEVEKIFTK